MRLRIEVDNTPGALARVAAVIADAGGNIHAVEVFEVNARRAVDEIDVELPGAMGRGSGGGEAAAAGASNGAGEAGAGNGAGPGNGAGAGNGVRAGFLDADEWRRRFEEAGAGRLLSCDATPLHADPMVRLLRALSSWERAGPDVDERLNQLIGDLCGAPVAWVEEMPGALRRDVARLALERGGPVVRRATQLQPLAGGKLPDEGWLAAIPDCPIGPMLVAFAVRPLSRPFSMTEIRRTEALLGLLRSRRSAPHVPLTASD